MKFLNFSALVILCLLPVNLWAAGKAPIPVKKDVSKAVSHTLNTSGNAVSASDLAQVEAEAKKISQQGAEYEQQANKVKKEIAEVNQKMIAAAKKIRQGEDEVAKTQQELTDLQKDLAASENRFSTDHGMLVETLSALQMLALRPSEAVLIQPLTPVDVMRSSILLRSSVHALKDQAETIRQSIEDINSQKEKIAKKIDDLSDENARLAKQQDEMQALSKQKNEMYNQLSVQSKEAKQKAQQLAAQAKDLRDLLEKLERQKEQERQRAEKERLAREREAERLRQQNNHSLAGTDYAKDKSAPAPQKVITNFSKAKGRLSRPARGPIVTAFHQELSKGVNSNGIDIKTVSKAQVVAPFDGTIIFSGPFKNFANLVIIDHGEGYTSLLSGMGSSYTEVGQMILAGEPVGAMPKGDNVKLHMEIRKNNHPINPSEWLAN